VQMAKMLGATVYGTAGSDAKADIAREAGADEVIISERPREGWSVVNEQGETVALDLRLTPELVRAGVAGLVSRLAALRPRLELSLTTNAIALADKAEHRKKLARADCSFDLGRADTQPRETQQIS